MTWGRFLINIKSFCITQNNSHYLFHWAGSTHLSRGCIQRLYVYFITSFLSKPPYYGHYKMFQENSIHNLSTIPNRKCNQSARVCITDGRYIGNHFHNHGNHLSDLPVTDGMYKKRAYRWSPHKPIPDKENVRSRHGLNRLVLLRIENVINPPEFV